MNNKLFIIISILLAAFFLYGKMGGAANVCKSKNVIYIENQEELDTLVHGEKTYFGMFYSPSCPHCHTVGKFFDELAEQKSEKIAFFVVNITKFNPYKVNVIPRFILFNDGEQVGGIIRITSTEQVEEILDEYDPTLIYHH